MQPISKKDLNVSLLGDDSVFFFPSTYKRSVQYEQTEPANIVLRTEVLNHLASGKRKRDNKYFSSGE